MHAQVATAPGASNGRGRPSCAECGVVEAMRRVERSGHADWADAGEVGVGEGVPGLSRGSVVAAQLAAGDTYEFTVRFRDGSTTVFNEKTPRGWRPGSRVIVIGGSRAATDWR